MICGNVIVGVPVDVSPVVAEAIDNIAQRGSISVQRLLYHARVANIRAVKVCDGQAKAIHAENTHGHGIRTRNSLKRCPDIIVAGIVGDRDRVGGFCYPAASRRCGDSLSIVEHLRGHDAVLPGKVGDPADTQPT